MLGRGIFWFKVCQIFFEILNEVVLDDIIYDLFCVLFERFFDTPIVKHQGYLRVVGVLQG